MTNELLDQGARTSAAGDLDLSTFIEAGAGTGKSSTLVERIVNTIRRPEPRITIDQIAAITFTEKAGTELRNRLRDGLERARASDPASTLLAEALENLDSATVGTIHSFAQTILREHAISAGIPLGFSLADDSAASAARAIRVRNAVEHLYVGLDTHSLEVLAAFDISLQRLREIINEIDVNALRLTDVAFTIDSSEQIETSRLGIIEQVASFWRAVQDSCSNTDDRLYQRFAEILPEMIEELRSADPFRMAELLHRWSKSNEPWLPALGNIGSGKNWVSGEPKQWRDSYKDLASPIAEFLFIPGDTAIRRGLSLAWQYITDQQVARHRSGNLEFDDLLVLTRDLLLSKRDVRSYVHEQFKVLMVDEFQDTDPLQWQIISMITGDPDDPKHKPLPGRLVVVGDPKQAIYSFRGADVETYIRAKDLFQSQLEDIGGVLSLTTNFRSTRPVINLVNEVFSQAMNPSVPHQVDYADLIAAHDPQDPDSGPAFLVVRDPVASGDDDTKYKSKEIEPQQIAYAISLAVKDGWKVTEPNESHSRAYSRPADFSDITILYPARTGRAALLDALDDFGIPYRSADAGLVYERPVVLGLRAAMTYAAEGLADLNLWLALKSPLFGLTDRDLLEYRLSGGQWRNTEDNPEGPVTNALRNLSRLRSTAVKRTPLQLIDQLLESTRVFEALPFTHRGNFEADCLRMFRAHAQQWQDQGGVGLYEYLHWVDSVVENAHRTSLPEPDDREDNAVRLMTTFQAKGLEFPIVAVAGMSHSPGSQDPMLGITSSSRFELRLSSLQMSSGYNRWYQEDFRPKQRAEATRVLYVAFTRARDHLIISLAGERVSTRKKDGEMIEQPPYASLLWPSIPRADSDITVLPITREPFAIPNRKALTQISPSWRERVQSIRERSEQRWVASPSGLGALALGVDVSAEVIDDQPFDPIEPTVDPAREMRDGSAIGQSVHRSLDILIRETEPLPQRIHQVCKEMAAEEDAFAHLETIVAMTNMALDSNVVAQARAAGSMWTELYLAAPVDEGSVKVVDGLADLVYRDDSGIHIIDYKTDASIGEHNLPHYREQLAAYAELMRRGTGEERITASVLHLTQTSAELISIV